MHNFRKIMLVFYGGFIWCQTVQIVTDNGYQSLTAVTEANQVLKQFLEESGDLGARFDLERARKLPLPRAEYRYSSGDFKVDSLVFFGSNAVHTTIASVVFQSLLRSKPESGTRKRFREVQTAFSFITDQTTLQFARYGEKRVAAIVEFNPEFKSYLSGLLGTNRSQSGAWETTGEFNLHLENPFGAATTTEVQWNQPSGSSRSLNLYAEIPALPWLPFGAEGNFSHELQGNLFMTQSLSGAITGLSQWGIWHFGLRSEVMLPLDGEDTSGSSDFQSRQIIAGLKGDRRNNRWLPSSGSHWNWSVVTGQTMKDQKSHRNLGLSINSGYFFNAGKQILYLKVWGQGTWVKNLQLHQGQQIRFGGNSTLRGYNKDQFSADWVVIPAVEWIPLHSRESQFFSFLNTAIYKTNYFPVGYGFGFRQFRHGFLVELVLGLSRGNKISASKIHIQVSTEL
ncbi:MAG: hypothetical protein ACE5D2_04255 [Fidelibacterota bacterium]